ncbi:MAG: glycosyltransferase family 4 protein [Bacteroidia bacterium]|jgi:hypothetical protein
MSKILYLTFLYEPDLSACSFRNSPLSKELSRQLEGTNYEIDLFTTLPNRYSTFTQEAPLHEKRGNLNINRIDIPAHKSGFVDQMLAYRKYFFQVLKATQNTKYDLVFVSSGRLFSCYLGYRIAKRNQAKLYLDIRDIFVDTINDVVQSKWIKTFLMPVLKYIESKAFNYASHINLISGGFKNYFSKFRNPNYTYFTNGIDDEFIEASKTQTGMIPSKPYTIVYAGNFGEGQGLHKIVPQTAALLGNAYKFILIGDGGAKNKLVDEIERLGVTNVEIRNPVNRKTLIQEYRQASILFIHLNDYAAFEKVLPSKVFELGVFNKPMLAGVKGYARTFITENLAQAHLFDPGDAAKMTEIVKQLNLETRIDPGSFIDTFNRTAINAGLAGSIVSYLPRH